jgi:hypothetical protein
MDMVWLLACSMEQGPLILRQAPIHSQSAATLTQATTVGRVSPPY